MRRGIDRSIWIAFAGFIIIGMPAGLIGVAWPGIQRSFGLTPSAIGMLALTSTLGFVSISLMSGALVARLGVRGLLVGAFIIQGMALVGMWLAPTWPLLVLANLARSTGDGAIDTGLNVYAARYRNPRLLNWLHACFGLGATLSPVLLTGLLSLGLDWRWGFLAVGLFSGAIVPLVLATRWRGAVDSNAADSIEPVPSPWATLRLPLAWLGVMMFVFYAGLEASTGQWSYSLLTASRGIDTTAAGLFVSAYWGTFTLGRFLFGVVESRIPAAWQMPLVLLGAFTGTLLLWLAPLPAVSLLGLAVMGFTFAPVFPLMVGDTVRRVGEAHAANAIGFQMAAASLGVSLFPWLFGLGIEAAADATRAAFLAPLTPVDPSRIVLDPAFEVVGPGLVLLAVVVVLVYGLITVSIARRSRQTHTGTVETGAAQPAPVTGS